MQSWTRWASLLVLTGTIVVLPACSGDDGPTDPPPASGAWRVELVSPNGDEGAALLALPSEDVGTIEPVLGELHTREVGDETRVLLLRRDPGKVSFLLEREGSDADPADVIELLQVASADNRLRDLAGYSVETIRE